ncbi:helicase-related protein [Microbulbifer sp. SA54]|uniref:helicase-related protein n=1 Tax=Microbulbifer sp. SA54 TaxID=3401577 RepID=UPI003AADBDD0
MSDKTTLVKRITEDLLGPLREDEQLHAYPTDVYLTGILFPPATDIAQEDADQLQAEGRRDIDANDVSQDEVSLATVKRPASAGISFVIDGTDKPSVNIQIQGAVYRPVANTKEDAQADGEKSKRVLWQRFPLDARLEDVTLDFPSRDFPPQETGIEGLGLHIRTSSWGKQQLVTVAMINEHKLPKEYERSRAEELTFFQTGLVVTCGENTHFCPRPLGGSAIDEDTRMAQLIYRDVKEYAVGHTCAATWSENEDGVSSVASTWLPTSTVKAMSSEGVKNFAPLSQEGILSTEWLSTARDDQLVSGLKRLPSLYEQWYQEQNESIESLDENLRDQARSHINNADEVRQRMQGAIDLIGSDSNVQTAFRLANRAIQLQRQWAAPDDKSPLIWRPFQLGFFLLTLESVADDEHKHRKTADLLWFPTGGGKTEAYLGLIAFTIILRRLRYGEQGAGVASFMRYTLRLLTVQQFQRAAALISACDALRQGYGAPPDIKVSLGDIPFSLGLWVGSDTTPNKFKDARDAMADAHAHNRPDQLKYCPRHKDTRLSWKIDSTNEQIIANCDHPDCLWREAPLPVWTVDNSVYRHKPSLVIGTVDKFAQIARKKDTAQLFGLNTRFRQPDLIIQDELHLISGPLGTLTGIYEIAIDKLCSRGEVVPKIIASTATIRQASSQIKNLFNRETCLFPPPILDASNSGFAVEDEDDPGRQYVGITTAGRSAKFTLQALSASLLQAVSSPEISDQTRDDFWTLVAYFNSLRELGGALVLMQDDVTNSLADYSGRRTENTRRISEPMELTSRVSSSEIKNYLDQLNKTFEEAGTCDVVLASNMISVGVDVPRLGSMIVNGQPKTIAEYIQATSRVGRRRGGPGGLVLSIYNNAKSRDRSHFETFNTWHKALYREVEATSVTPFAPRARDKALHAVLVILARHLIPELSDEAWKVSDYEEQLQDLIEYVVARAEDIDEEEADSVEDALQEFLEKWLGSAKDYQNYWNDRAYSKSLLLSAERAAEIKSRAGTYHGRATPTPNSMRNVEPGSLFVLTER